MPAPASSSIQKSATFIWDETLGKYVAWDGTVDVGTITVTGGVTDAQIRASPVPVKANAGTDLNTSRLALESGGNLETIASSHKSLTTAIEYSAGNLLYLGKAPPGTQQAAAGWQVKKFTFTGDDLTGIQYAGGTESYTRIWNDRATYNYS